MSWNNPLKWTHGVGPSAGPEFIEFSEFIEWGKSPRDALLQMT